MTPTERFLRFSIILTALLASAALWWPAPAQAARIKEVASVQGVRMNQLTGYGLVVGLDGTGDQNTSAPFLTQSLLALLQQMGFTHAKVMFLENNFARDWSDQGYPVDAGAPKQ